eukprot:TRINITY_DN21156_c0_g1_i1.p1 TRINITY_DN21156_c0_g1~~TRINITY_DN21156_c0_g1_i1.p1  ORF type:complete len:230 (-),score=32.05 TRINITY_DN21156_c0_g1_i1:23-712(-)
MAEHVVFLQHGICGSPGELCNISAALSNRHHSSLRCVVSEANYGLTFDGVVAGGCRLAELVKKEITHKGSSVSFVCHSLGGIYARQALRKLEEERWFDEQNVRCLNFVTLASPHLGTTELPRWQRAVLRLCPARTSADLVLSSSVLQSLADDVALSSLQRFDRRALYGCTSGDLWVRPCTALLLPSSPDAMRISTMSTRVALGCNDSAQVDMSKKLQSSWWVDCPGVLT